VIYEYFYKGLMLRMAGAAVLAFLLVTLLGPRTIRFLLRRKLGDRPEFDHADLNELTRQKSNTPTMGGALVVLAILAAVLMFANLGNFYIIMGLLVLIWLGGLGGVDDWIKLRYSAGTSSRQGLRSWEKILFQAGLAVLISVFMRSYSALVPASQHFYLPFKANPIYLPLFAHILITLLTMVGASNAVNITDGMDGLATGCLIIVAGFFVVISWIVGVREWSAIFHLPLVTGSEEMTILCAAMGGGCLGFLWFNAHPAQVFLGDTGSLPLGGLIGYIAVVTRQEMLLLIAGGVFVVEVLSVVLQVGYFKLTKRAGGIGGKRLFRCAPLHHHFHLGGLSESKVVARFWIAGIIFAALALATLKLR